MAKYIKKDLGLGDQPYQQNIPEPFNCSIKEWTNFIPPDLDKFITSIYDFAESFEIKNELAWFRISEEWEVKKSYCQHMPKVPYVLVQMLKCTSK